MGGYCFSNTYDCMWDSGRQREGEIRRGLLEASWRRVSLKLWIGIQDTAENLITSTSSLGGLRSRSRVSSFISFFSLTVLWSLDLFELNELNSLLWVNSTTYLSSKDVFHWIIRIRKHREEELYFKVWNEIISRPGAGHSFYSPRGLGPYLKLEHVPKY